MPEKVVRTIFICPYCHRTYDNHTDAQDCAEDCADIESPKCKTLTFWRCDICQTEEWENEDDAAECEERHRKNRDKKYYFALDRTEREKLLNAAKARGQKTIKEALR